jgi:hypothetical protein
MVIAVEAQKARSLVCSCAAVQRPGPKFLFSETEAALPRGADGNPGGDSLDHSGT